MSIRERYRIYRARRMAYNFYYMPFREWAIIYKIEENIDSMKLVQDHSIGARSVSVPCLVCGVMLTLSDAIMDRNGQSFQAYYHRECLPKDHPHINKCPDTRCVVCYGN